MKRALFARTFSGRDFHHNHRSFSQLVQREASLLQETSDVVPKMPPFDYSRPPYTGPSADEILQKRKEYLSPSIFYFYNNPLNLVDGKMQYLFDDNGRRYLDAYAGIATVCCGHCHPDVVEAVVNQTKRLQHSTPLYLNHTITDFAEALASKLPGDLKVVFFTNSGTEANELAMMMARLYTGSHDIISLRNAYHGNASGTMGTTGQSNWKFNVVQVKWGLEGCGILDGKEFVGVDKGSCLEDGLGIHGEV
ncbi:hypothetical protein NE237_004292 [Protea cynaroides]|uniref:Alanine-glyoxylate aminotransferase n=1 Tax=Protea cynaroides TaxID=273540 RepID=A0A9Q0KIE4_9MAGN|nr:hypothetical protein NE237_004292 [Protea cynaroides]